MLRSLYIRNFALIDDVEVNFDKGLTIVTGETGAGKSMLIDALQVALGSRASADFIRSGREKATVQATFDVSKLTWMKKRMEELGVDCEEDGLLFFSRELSHSGKNTCRINGRPVNLSLYREIGSGLVDMLGQHEQQTLLDQDRHRWLLDKLGGPELLDQAVKVKEIYTRWRNTSSELKDLETSARELARRMDMLSFQVQEITKAQLAEDEEDELINERRLLMNSEKISRLAGEAYDYLYGGETGVTPAIESVGKALASLRELAEIDSDLAGLVEVLETALYQMEDAAREVSSYRDNVEYNPERLNQIEHRLSLIKQLKYKYGSTVKEILEYKDAAVAELNTLNNRTEKAEELKAAIKDLEQEWRREAKVLTKLRQKAANQLEEKAAKELRYLEMGGIEFRVSLTPTEEVSARGMEDIEFLIAPNPGEPLRPLQKIASGGELSRIMLALKVLLSGVDEVPTLIFDEIDTGVGGKALQAIGEKLAQVGRHRQVICVTHGPQVACFADTHYLISKKVVNGHTQTSVECLDQTGRVEELARMLAGREITGVVKDHALQMLKMSAAYKK
ncbi:DNA replication and repair protein RecN [Desulforamulus putei DSM 12395]|uniref:DNA repair protein RecN n=1 Tax=Desulforamulus putei DSM 12395 TaxID=1121429 RepID=A0A1M4V245_9FIRM|nr:DNA repair protein RecN [Desulforamulus putei]SHE63025.1 DNA replication and repair protein RecN [Desulforamulus putei DSM 12395]